MRKASCPSRGDSGFTLIEALMAIGMGTIFLVSAMGTWVYATKTWKEENLRGKLRYDLETSVEKLKEDIRLSDAGQILFYPPSSTTYTAVGMPRAYPNDNGLYDYDDDDGIEWEDQIIYSVEGGALIRTVVPYSSTTATRQAQVDAAGAGGSVSGGVATTLFEADEIEMSLTPATPVFDGYAASLERSANISFGAVPLTPGTHTVRFLVEGKNAASSGYRLGLDTLVVTPSGGGREMESMTISASSGKTGTTEDMSDYGDVASWGGGHQYEYPSSGSSDYVEFSLYNDEWLEGNFTDMTHSYTEVTGDDPALSLSTRESQGSTPSWRADAQTGAVEADNPGTIANSSVRNVILGSSMTTQSTMIRFKFKGPAAGSNLVINSAYVGLHDGAGNFVGESTQLHFGNETVSPEETDSVGATGSTGGTSITIAPGDYVWSNWIVYSIADPSTDEYLVSFSVGAQGGEAYWQASSGVHSYVIAGDVADDVWDPDDYTASAEIHAVSEMQSWYHIGTATSQIYDTRMSDPAFSQATWVEDGSGTYTIKVRSSDNADMAGAAAWSAVAGSSSSPAGIGGAGTGRYVQFQMILTGSSPYTEYPTADNISVRWPGQSSFVEFSGYFTKRPNYGTFTVEVDGEELVSALEVDLSATETYQGKDQTYNLSTEIKARNTGK